MAMAVWTLISWILVLVGIVSFVLFIIVLFKLNKALNIWLAENKRN